MGISEFVATKSVQEFIEYGKKFDGMKFKSEDEAEIASKKLWKMLSAYGFKVLRPFSYSKDNTSWLYALKIESDVKDGNRYLRVHVGWIQKSKTLSIGMFRVDQVYESAPIGTITYDDLGQAKLKTKMGYWTGD